MAQKRSGEASSVRHLLTCKRPVERTVAEVKIFLPESEAIPLAENLMGQIPAVFFPLETLSGRTCFAGSLSLLNNAAFAGVPGLLKYFISKANKLNCT